MDSATIEQLLAAASCNDDTGQATLHETHISWVILSGDFAYKIKKPVSFGFLDFSSLQLRRHFCGEELRLNRRFSPELYLAVVAITRDERGAQIEGSGPTIDYAVKMRRFDEEQLLDNVAACGGLSHSLLRALGRELAQLHSTLPTCHPDPAGGEPGTPAALVEAIEQNFLLIRKYPLPKAQLAQLRAVRQWSQQRYKDLLPVLTQRVLDGWVIDGHGDAHLGNIALVDGAVRLFDCIEFNASFRIMDSVSEIAFLTMDLDARGYHNESHRLLTDYLEYRGDYAGLALLDLYRSYFAMVRAKVSLLREAEQHTALTSTDGYREFLRYLQLAQRYIEPNRCFLAITHGVSGTGKSTIAGGLVAASGAVRIRSDVERKRLAGLSPEQRSAPRDEAELYGATMSRKTFSRLETLAAMTVGAGFGVIIDATFLHRRVRDSFRELARKLSVPFVIIDCVAEPDQMRERLVERERRRQDASEAGVAVMEQQLAVDQALSGKELGYRLEADSGEDAAKLWQRFQDQCWPNEFGPTG
jgi:aminoglycoside phosphotransferase family enzyme/predicted kinase